MITVYHVTDQEGDKPPTWQYVMPSVNRDAYYDGPLVGLKTVSTSSTLMNGKLPRWSPYPSRGQAGSKFWRSFASLLLLNKNDPVERDFAKVLTQLDFEEYLDPLVNEFKEPPVSWINCHFLQPLKVESWDRVVKRNYGPGKLVTLEQDANVSLETTLGRWIEKHRGKKKISLPERFEKFKEPSRSEYERERNAAAIIANLDTLYKRCLDVLGDFPVDLMTVSLNRLSKLLREFNMPPLCISCLRQFSPRELREHLLAERNHIYSLKEIKAEKALVRAKIKEDGSEESAKVKVIFAVKMASLIKLNAARRR